MLLADYYKKASELIRDKGYSLECPDQGHVFVLPNDDFDALYDYYQPRLAVPLPLGDHHGLPYLKFGRCIVRREEPYDSLLEELWIDKSIHRS